MRFALVNGERKEPASGLIGLCEGCQSPMVAKCGNVKVHHWAHKSKIECDPWWENETEWHRNWKRNFPEPWQEVLHRSDTGTFHRADVKTDKNWILEFQYSAISSEERESRNDFYGKITWVVHGLRRKKDPVQFFSSLKAVGSPETPLVRRICNVTSEKSALLQEWSNDKVPVFFDFGEPEVLWCLLPRNAEGRSVVVEFPRQRFVELHQPNFPTDFFGDLIQFLSTATSAENLIQKFHEAKRAEEQRRIHLAEEARRRNPFINHRAMARRRL